MPQRQSQDDIRLMLEGYVCSRKYCVIDMEDGSEYVVFPFAVSCGLDDDQVPFWFVSGLSWENGEEVYFFANFRNILMVSEYTGPPLE